MSHALDQIPVLTAAERETVAETIHASRDLWTQRHDDLPFYTLGVASYLDAAGGRGVSYLDAATAFNPKLRERFGWLYSHLAERLADHLGAPVLFDDTHLALPGFHIFLAHPAFTQQAGRRHYDLQYRDLVWNGHGPIDFSRQLSLTLSVRLPAAGGGLRLWQIDLRELDDMDPEARQAHMQRHRKADLVPYKEGALVIHSGHQLHQIAPAPEMVPGDERLTLQAHAAPTQDGWLLYW